MKQGNRPSEPASPPAALGYRMPAEWELHEATWIAWPHNRADWPGKFSSIAWVHAEIVRHLHLAERVRILVNDGSEERRARRVLEKAGVDLARIQFFPFVTDRVWIRDYGPLFIKQPSGELALTDWQFNGWAKYPNWQNDNRVTPRVQKILGCMSWQPRSGDRRVVLEGGSIEVNGGGLLLTTEECLLDSVQARNPGLGREELERAWHDYLGVRKVLWLGRGIAGDDTHGHIDDLARFVTPTTVVTVMEKNASDVNYQPLQDNWDRLHSMTDLDGHPLEVVPLPMPDPVWFAGQRLPASYANFYIANDRVLVPTFNDVHDRVALGVLADLFPSRKVVGIHAVDLVWGLGTLHCMTQQQPAGNS
jgi:agmatine deiminase